MTLCYAFLLCMGVISCYADNVNYVTPVISGDIATLDWPEDMVQDSSGNFYVVDVNKHKILKITPAGVVTTFAGTGTAGFSNHTTATSAQFKNPSGIAMDASGHLYVADSGNHCIRKITVSNGNAGAVSTFSGMQTAGYKNATNTTSQFNTPTDIVFYNNYFYVTDFGNHAIRQITSTGSVTTVSGGIGAGGIDGAGNISKHNGPYRLAINKQSAIYVADSTGHTIRKITFIQGATPTNVSVTTIAGLNDDLGYKDGVASRARFNQPTGIAVDDLGNVFVADLKNNAVRMITAQGIVRTLSGEVPSTDDNGATNTMIRFNAPSQCYVNALGDLYITERDEHAIQKMSLKPNYSVSTMKIKGSALNYPHDMTQDSKGNYFVVNRNGHQIIKITPTGTASVFAGSGAAGYQDGTSAVAKFNNPTSLVCDSADNLYVVDINNNRIRKITPAGVVSTFAGSGAAATTNGTGVAAAFNAPYYIRMDKSGNSYVSEWNGHVIRKITPSGVVSTIAGTVGLSGYANGVGTAVKFRNPSGLHVDDAGNVYVADYSNHAIRKITTTGAVITLSGNNATDTGSNGAGAIDGIPSIAQFNGPHSIAVDALGNVFVVELNGHRVRMITPDNFTRTIAGNGVANRIDHAFGPFAQFNGPTAAFIDKTQKLIVVERGTNALRSVVSRSGIEW